MLRQAEAEAVTATAVATATVSRMRLRLREQQNPTTGFSSESYGECFHICFYTSLLGCFAGIIFDLAQKRSILGPLGARFCENRSGAPFRGRRTLCVALEAGCGWAERCSRRTVTPVSGGERPSPVVSGQP